MKNLNEEVNKIKHLFNYKKGDVKKVLNEQGIDKPPIEFPDIDIPFPERGTGDWTGKDERTDPFTLSSTDPYEYYVEDIDTFDPSTSNNYYTRKKGQGYGSWKNMEKELSPEDFKIAKERIDDYMKKNKIHLKGRIGDFN